MQGILCQNISFPQRARLTPAHARNTYQPSWRLGTSTAHPRSHGEYHILTLCRSKPYGSPPLARRILSGCPILQGPLRFTPARTENTLESYWQTTLSSVHPPLARRIPLNTTGEHTHIRFTPARTENTQVRKA